MQHSLTKLRIGVIGAGFISQVAHLRALSKSPIAEIVAIADARSSLAQQVATNFAIPSVYTYYDEMLAQTSLDAVIVCVARPCLGAAVATALERKVPTFSEKPMAQTCADAEKLVNLSVQNETDYFLGFMRRSDPGVHLFKEKLSMLMADNSFGSVISVTLQDFCGEYAVPIPFHIRAGEKPSYRYPEWQKIPDFLPIACLKDYEYSLNVLIHDINLLRYLFETQFIPKIFTIKKGFSQTALVETKDFPISIHVGCAKLGKWEQVVHVYFERGRLSLHLPSPLAQQDTACVEELASGKHSFTFPTDKTWAFERQMEDFLKGLQGQKKLTSTGKDSLCDIALIERLWSINVL